MTPMPQLVNTILGFVDKHGCWEGAGEELAERLAAGADRWALAAALQRAAPALRRQGIEVHVDRLEVRIPNGPITATTPWIILRRQSGATS